MPRTFDLKMEQLQQIHADIMLIRTLKLAVPIDGGHEQIRMGDVREAILGMPVPTEKKTVYRSFPKNRVCF